MHFQLLFMGAGFAKDPITRQAVELRFPLSLPSLTMLVPMITPIRKNSGGNMYRKEGTRKL